MLQSQALDILKMGKNVFLTGAAGSGKTYVLREYISFLRKHHIEVAITASTGIAATHLGGQTIHSWSGLGIRDSLTQYDLEALLEKQQLVKRYEKTKVLIIDEVSMLHHFRFDLLDKLARAFKKNDLPFGGMQIVLCGDFFQLPPVTRRGEPEALFIYRSRAWRDMNLVICYLEEQHRQNDDNFLSVLNAIRNSEIDEGVYESLQDRFQKELEGFEGVVPTKLYSHNIDVDTINLEQLKKLKGHEELYLMDNKGRAQLVEALVKSCLAPEELRLKVGAHVMFVKNNLEKKYANGTLGTVVGFNADHFPIVRTAQGHEIVAEPESWMIEEDGKIKAEISQVPLRLAWAITIHKSQGMSLDAAEIDLSKSFVAGMGYVALSRVKSLAGLKLVGFNNQALAVHPEIADMDREFRKRSDAAVDRLVQIQEGQGEKSLADMQQEFIDLHATDIPFEDKPEKTPSYMLTKSMLEERMPLKQMAKERGVKEDTVIDHIEQLIKEGVVREEGIDISYLKNEQWRDPRSRLKFSKIKDVFVEMMEAEHIKKPLDVKLSPVKQKLGNSFSYAEIRLARLFLID